MALTGREQRNHGREMLSNVRRLFGYIIHYWQLKAILVLIVLTTILEVLSPAIIGNIIDRVRSLATGSGVTVGKGIGELVNMMLIPISRLVSDVFGINFDYAILGVSSLSLIFFTSLTGVFNYLRRYASSYISQRASYDIRSELYNSLLEQSFSFYDKQKTGQLMARATSDVRQIERLLGFGATQLVSTLLLFVFVIYSLISINWKLTLISLVFFPLIFFTIRRYAMLIRPLWSKMREQFGDITSFAQENIMGVRLVRGFAMEPYEEKKFAEECESYFGMQIEAAKIRSLYMPLATLITSFGFALIIIFGGKEVMRGTLTIGSLVAFYFYAARLSSPMRMIGFMTSLFQRSAVATERIFEIIDAKVSVSDREDAFELNTVEGHIAFENVWFGYEPVNMVLKEINLKVRPGDNVAILGATGSGKSSFINLIPRFYDVNRGRIKIDGHDVRSITIKSLRRHIGIVRQDPFIFSTTIMGNLTYGVENAKFEDVEAVAKRTQIYEFIISLKEGFNTKVGERGVTLSGGQKQRIAIARVLLKDPKILILDDSTSSVDTQTEFEIQRSLEELMENRTTFIITQRLSTIRDADYILVMDRGEIVEEGTHEQLMEKKGIYYRLYMTQISESRNLEE